MKLSKISILVTGAVILLAILAAVQLTRSAPPSGLGQVASKDDQSNTSISISPALFRTVSENAGELRMAGTSQPHASLVLSQSAQRLGEVKADEAGNWTAILPINPQETQAINLIMVLEDGTRMRSDETLFRIPKASDERPTSNRSIDTAVVVPSTPFEAPTLILLTTPGGPSRVIKSPFGGMPISGPLSLGPIDYDDSGGAVFRGRSASGGRVRIYANEKVIGDASVQADGQWFYMIAETLPRGSYDIAVALMDGSKETARITVPFEKMGPASDEQAGGGLYVSFEPKRWQVRRDLLGGGAQYTALFAPE